MHLVVGVDAGGTGSRAVVASLSGQVVGRASAGPGNPLSGGVAAAAEIGTAIGRALGAHPASHVVAGVLALAGTSAMADPAVAAAFGSMWTGLGFGAAPMTVVGDAVTAFAAGTPCPSGLVLIAGTGALAARIRSHAVAQTVDGHGWLLGDEGSGRWIGLAALRAAVRDWPSPLAVQVAARAGAATPDSLIRWAQTLPLAEIGALTRVVCTLARSGDPTAGGIVATATERLVATLTTLTLEDPVVLAGGLLVADTPVRDGVLAALHDRGVTVRIGSQPAAAAAWLAARGISRLPPDSLHGLLTA